MEKVKNDYDNIIVGETTMNFLETMLSTIASITIETTSWFGFYEPEIKNKPAESETAEK